MFVGLQGPLQGPDDTKCPTSVICLEVVKNERLIFTNACTSGWAGPGQPFVTDILTFEDERGQTRYIARARHWTAEDCATHKKMGFYEGWGIATDQLAALAATLS